MVTWQSFGNLSDGQNVTVYTITNRSGEYVQLLDYGASIHQVMVLDRNGDLGDVVLGAPDAKRLLTSTYVGGTIGRVGNRIADGRFVIDGKIYQLEKNCSGHFLHGGSENYARRIFDSKPEPEENRVTFYLHDDGKVGFDCTAEVIIRYTFDDEGSLEITYEMSAGGDTVFNPTNHTYFNLAGYGDIRDHHLKLYASYRAKRDENGIPDGGLVSVKDSAADFTVRKSIREAIASDKEGYFQKQPPGYDEFYKLDKKGYGLAAELDCPASGRRMQVYTDMPCIILFAGGSRAPEQGKNNEIYKGYCGICLETEFMPNAVNCPAYVSPIYRKGQKLISRTVYKFICMQN